MNAWVVSLIAFVCVLIGAAIGSALRVVLPEAHLREDTKDMVKVGVGLLVTLSALVMGLLIASVKDSFDTQSAEVRQAATRLILLDRTLRQYGPEADPIRATLRSEVATRTEIAWMKTGAQPPAPAGDVVSSVQMRLMALPATNDTQRHLRDNAVRLGEELMQMRWLLYEQSAGTIAVRRYPFAAPSADGWCAAGVGVGLVRDPPTTVDACDREVVDEVTTGKVVLHQHRDPRVPSDVDQAHIARVVRARHARTRLDHRDEVTDGHIGLHVADVAEHAGVRVERLLQLGEIATCAIDVELDDRAHVCNVLQLILHQVPPWKVGAAVSRATPTAGDEAVTLDPRREAGTGSLTAAWSRRSPRLRLPHRLPCRAAGPRPTTTCPARAN